MAKGAWFLGLAALSALLGSVDQVAAAEDCPSLTLRFWVAGKEPEKDREVSGVEFLSDGRRFLHRNGLDISDFVALPIRDGRGRLIGETYERTSDHVRVLRVDFERDAADRIVRETLRLARAETDSEVFPEWRTLGWYTYQWDHSGRLAELAFFWLSVTGLTTDANEANHHKILFKYDGASRSPAEATVFREIPSLDMVGSFQPWASLRFVYDKQGMLLGAQDEGAFRISVRGPSCAHLPERLFPVVLNPFGGPWRPVVGNPTSRFPTRVPSLPR